MLGTCRSDLRIRGKKLTGAGANIAVWRLECPLRVRRTHTGAMIMFQRTVRREKNRTQGRGSAG